MTIHRRAARALRATMLGLMPAVSVGATLALVPSATPAVTLMTPARTATAGESAKPLQVSTVARPLPSESIYQLTASLTDQHGRPTSLASLRGRPALLAMFYASCDGVCPLLALTMRRIDASLTPAERNRIRLSMISFDPERDTPSALSEFAHLNHLDDPRWLVATASDATVRDIAAVLDIRYRRLPSGVYSHSAPIILLDADGVIRARTETLKEIDPQFMQAVQALL